MNKNKFLSFLAWFFLLLGLVFCYGKYVQNTEKKRVEVAGFSQTVATTTLQATKTEKVEPGLSDTTFTVVRVIDGDTIVVSVAGIDEKVRLIGINTPETVDPRRAVQCFGHEASNKTKELLEGRQVTLVPDQTQDDRDKYGRLLRYVYRADGLFINKYLLSEGFAYEYTYRIPYTFQKEFKQAQTDARANKKGLWADGVCGGNLI